MTFSTKVFGNALDAETNFVVLGNHLRAYWKSRGQISSLNEVEKKKVQEIRQQGYTVLPAALNVDTLAEKVEEYFASPVPLRGGYEDMSPEAAKTLASLCLPVIERVTPILENYYHSHFQPLWGVFHRIKPGVEEPASSQGFHSDNNPVTSMKIMLYLQDTYRDTGAFRLFDRKHTKLLCKKNDYIYLSNGYRSQTHQQMYEEFGEQLESWLSYCEGPKGSIAIFDNNLLHKGTLPQKAKRDSLVFQFFPSYRPTTLADVERALSTEQMSTPIVFSKRKFVKNLISPLWKGIEAR